VATITIYQCGCGEPDQIVKPLTLGINLARVYSRLSRILCPIKAIIFFERIKPEVCQPITKLQAACRCTSEVAAPRFLDSSKRFSFSALPMIDVTNSFLTGLRVMAWVSISLEVKIYSYWVSCNRDCRLTYRSLLACLHLEHMEISR
jgi:hypothetical protein